MDRIKYLQNFGSKLDKGFYKELKTGTKYNAPLLDENGDKIKTILVESKLIQTPIDEFKKENIRIELHLRDNNKLLLIKRIPIFRKASQLTKINKILNENYKFEKGTEFANMTVDDIIESLKINIYHAKQNYITNNVPEEILEVEREIDELKKQRVNNSNKTLESDRLLYELINKRFSLSEKYKKNIKEKLNIDFKF